ncbi:MAG: hypothetical protein EKK54_11100 [Neisseriaceae bacterium]|nr:MAG: hypothetical protein EKK54_11100 [Neisseriaceae bacterium]
MIKNFPDISVYNAQTKNVKHADKIYKYLVAQANAHIKRNKESELSYVTSLLQLTYCAYAESLFLKIIHTPYGFKLDEIKSIKLEVVENGITAGWKKCIEIALRKTKFRKSSHCPNVKKELNKLINTYLLNPSQIRNKLAHGQFVIALRKDNNAVNDDLTDSIERLDIVEISKNYYALSLIAKMVEDIVESPEKAHINQYYSDLCKLEEELKSRSKWTLKSKKVKLLKKAQNKKL